MYHINNLAGRTAYVNDEEYLFFSGYSYLGISQVDEYIQLVKEGIDQYGILHPSSRISNTQLKIYEEFEQELSALLQTEETVSFSSGYLAGRAVMDLFKTERVYLLPGTHPVLKNDGAVIIQDIPAFVEQANTSDEKEIVVGCDAVNPLQASVQDLSFLSGINKKIICIVDASHSIGLLDEVAITNAPLLDNVDYIFTYSLSKAYHLNGGAVSCNHTIATRLRLSPFYTASTAIAPSFVYAFLHGRHLYKLQQEKLQYNVSAFITLIKSLAAIHYHPTLPVFILPGALDDVFFKQHKMIISSFAYPTPGGRKINRVIVNALHTTEDMQKLSDAIHSI